MSQVPITIKIDADIKLQAQAVGKKLGLSLSAIIENKLREVVRERRVVFEEGIEPTDATAQLLKTIEADVQADRNLSKPFNSFEALEQHLNNL